MARVDDWFFGFVAEHRARHPHAGLPDTDTPEGESLYSAWRAVFIKRGIQDHAVATEASELLTGETIRFPREHFPRLIDLAVGVYKARQAEGTANPATDRDAAVIASKDCPRCGGGGLAPVYHPDPKFARYAFSGHCVCPMGRWMRSKLADADRARIVDLDRPAGWLLDPPGFDAADMAAALAHFTVPELIRDMVSRGRSRRDELQPARTEGPRP